MVQSLAVSNDRFYATGKRKSSIARVWLKVGSGTILVNGKKYNEYFKRPVLQLSIEKPFNVINKNNGYDVKCTVKGGGLTGLAVSVSVTYFTITTPGPPCNPPGPPGAHGQ
jgi:small subunit ribosomal protein S9